MIIIPPPTKMFFFFSHFQILPTGQIKYPPHCPVLAPVLELEQMSQTDAQVNCIPPAMEWKSFYLCHYTSLAQIAEQSSIIWRKRHFWSNEGNEILFFISMCQGTLVGNHGNTEHCPPPPPSPKLGEKSNKHPTPDKLSSPPSHCVYSYLLESKARRIKCNQP